MNIMEYKFVFESFDDFLDSLDSDLSKKNDPKINESREEERGKIVSMDEISFDFSNYFPSGQFRIKETKELNDLVEKISKTILKYKENLINNRIEFNIKAGESRVPNQPPFKEPGSLARARAEEIKKYLTNKLKDIGVKIEFNAPEVEIGDTEWDPKKGKDYQEYTREQFVNLSIDLSSFKEKPISVKIVPKPTLGGGNIVQVGFTDGTMYTFDKNDKNQRELLKNFTNSPEFQPFRKKRHELSLVCNRHPTLCDWVKYEKKNYVKVDTEEKLEKLMSAMKGETLEFPRDISGQEVKKVG
jgi:hypothetical protein